MDAAAPGSSAPVDGAISRLLHAVNRPALSAAEPAPERDFTAEEQQVIDSAEQYLEDGIRLLRWWEAAELHSSFSERFDLQRSYNQAASSYGFFGSIDVRGRALPLMGNVQEMVYDNPRVPSRVSQDVASWIRDQVREFVLRYFMRISDFRQPESAATYARPAPTPIFSRLTWCPGRDVVEEGFGFSQQFYKLRTNGRIGRFPPDRASKIIDLRELGDTYEWIIAKVRIFDFDVTLRPFGESGPELVFTLNEESHLVLSRELITNQDDPAANVLGDYAVGYAFIKTPQSGFLAYGPGRFEAAVEIIRFRVIRGGGIRVHMVFVANRPASIASVSADPIDWGIWAVTWLTAGTGWQILRPVRELLDRRPFRIGTFDPVYGYVSLANGLTGGAAARQLCISREALDKQFLVQHFKQHYQTLVGSLLTWRQITDWTDESSLPDWVVNGANE
jgi:hypothetical protein